MAVSCLNVLEKIEMQSKLTMVVCAYKASPFLEEALKSVAGQNIPVKLMVATSTPSEYIESLAQKYKAEYLVNPHRNGIAADWDFALSAVGSDYAVIVHQDDIYFPDYAGKVVAAFEKHPAALIAFTDYGDWTSDGRLHEHRFYLWIKRMLLWAFYLKHYHHCRFFKMSALALGNAICCPAVSYNMKKLKTLQFDRSYSVNLDWAMWLRLANMEGGFAFIPRVLMAHRIADSMETAAAIADKRRYNEDKRVFEAIWGRRIAGWLMRSYAKAYASNQVKVETNKP